MPDTSPEPAATPADSAFRGALDRLVTIVQAHIADEAAREEILGAAADLVGAAVGGYTANQASGQLLGDWCAEALRSRARKGA